MWDALLPSFSSCMKTFPMTMSSSCLNTVENTTVTRSSCASTYLEFKKYHPYNFKIFFACDSARVTVRHSIDVIAYPSSSPIHSWIHCNSYNNSRNGIFIDFTGLCCLLLACQSFIYLSSKVCTWLVGGTLHITWNMMNSAINNQPMTQVYVSLDWTLIIGPPHSTYDLATGVA